MLNCYQQSWVNDLALFHFPKGGLPMPTRIFPFPRPDPLRSAAYQAYRPPADAPSA